MTYECGRQTFHAESDDALVNTRERSRESFVGDFRAADKV